MNLLITKLSPLQVIYSVWCPNIILSNLFSNIPILCSSLSARDQVSDPYKTTGKIIDLCILICMFLQQHSEGFVICSVCYLAHIIIIIIILK